MRSLLLALLLVGCVSDDSSTKDAGNDVTTNDASNNDVVTTTDASDAGAWSPNAFGTDLALWLVGDNVSDTAGSVDTWYDQSTYKTNPVSPDPNFRPLHEKGVLNGHDVVDFNQPRSTVGVGVGDAGVTPANLSFGQSDDFVIASVISASASMPSAYVWMKAKTLCNGVCQLMDGLIFAVDLPTVSSPDNVEVRESQADNYLFTNTQPLADHAYHVLVARRIGETTLQLRTDTIPKNATITGFDVSQTSYALTIGASFGTFQGSMAFRMAELIAVHRSSGAINDLEVANIETYLKGKYKTP